MYAIKAKEGMLIDNSPYLQTGKPLRVLTFPTRVEAEEERVYVHFSGFAGFHETEVVPYSVEMEA